MTWTTASRRWFWCACALAVLSAAMLASVAPHFGSGTELVRLRNALLIDTEPAQTDWMPAVPPTGFKLESLPGNALYEQVVREQGFTAAEGDWEAALAIARHMLSAGRAGTPGGIQSNLDETYRRIVYAGDGYCGDYVDVFIGLANVTGVFSRAWAFSFDGFGGDGHVLNEIWDGQRGRWLMLDVFHNYYVVNGSGAPLSATEFRAALEAGIDDTRLMPISETAPPGFVHEPRAWEYYRRGVPEWYLWMGNNVFEYDASVPVRLLGGIHRAAEQLGAIVAGVHPRIRLLDPVAAQRQHQAMLDLRLRLMLLTATVALAVLCLIGSLVSEMRGRNRSREGKFD